jgi:type II secretion system (T2SS) protein E
VTEDLIVKALSKQLGIARATFRNVNVPSELMQKVDVGFARTNGMCPEHFDPGSKTLTVAMVDPTNVAAIDELAFKTGYKIQTTIAGEGQINEAIDQHLGPGIPFGSNFESRRYGVEPGHAQMAASGIALDDAPADGEASLLQSSVTAREPQKSEALEMARRIDGAQKQQKKAIRAMVELLIEKGIFSRDEYMDLVNKR